VIVLPRRRWPWCNVIMSHAGDGAIEAMMAMALLTTMLM
jgi:hypothetical protein